MAPSLKISINQVFEAVIPLACGLVALVAEPRWAQAAGWIACNTLVVWAVSIQFGYVGILSLYNGCFIAIGSYLTVCVSLFGDFISAMIAAAFAFAILILASFPAFRRSKYNPLYFVLLGLGISSLGRHFLVNGPKTLGGANGLFLSFREAWGVSLSERDFTLMLPAWLSIAIAVFVLLMNFVIPKTARTFMLLTRDAPEISSILGIEPMRWRFYGFIISSIGLVASGCAFALMTGGAYPDLCTSNIPLLGIGLVLLSRKPSAEVAMLMAVCLGLLARASEIFIPDGFRLVEASLLLIAVLLARPQSQS